MNIIIDDWITSVKKRIAEIEGKLPSSIKKHTKKFSDAYIRNLIYDYLEENLIQGIDGYNKIIVRTHDGSEAAVLTVVYSDGDKLICEENENVRRAVFYVTHFRVLYNEKQKRKIDDIELGTVLGYKDHNIVEFSDLYHTA